MDDFPESHVELFNGQFGAMAMRSPVNLQFANSHGPSMENLALKDGDFPWLR
jgi:hypothetical protein